MSNDKSSSIATPGPEPINLGAVASSAKLGISIIEKCDPVYCAGVFGALSTVDSLQGSLVRLEVLTHLTLAIAQGTERPSSDDIAGCFVALKEEQPGRYEDPAEDLFVLPVNTERGTSRVLGGIWESPHFYLERVLAVLDRMPRRAPFTQLVEASYALLKLSDEICERAGYGRIHVGSELPIDVIPSELLDALPRLYGRVKFSNADLAELGITIESLNDFVLPDESRCDLLSQSLGNTSLERRPLIQMSDGIVFVLPSASATAIRLNAIERISQLGMRENFLVTLARDYTAAILNLPMLGGRAGTFAHFEKVENHLIAIARAEVDVGRRVGIIFEIDNLEGIEQSGLGFADDAGSSASESDELVLSVIDSLQKEEGFLSGVIVFVGCGIGRGFIKQIPKALPDSWRLVVMTASNFVTLCWLPDFKPLTVWRILDGEDDLNVRFNVHLLNINGFLNLVAWSRMLRGSLVPPDLPKQFMKRKQEKLVAVQQNALLQARREVANYWDPHRQEFIDGTLIPVRRTQHSFVDEDRRKPLYFEDDAFLKGRFPRCVYVTDKRAWWAELKLGAVASGEHSYQRAVLVSLWLTKAAQVFDRHFSALPFGPVLWQAEFSGQLGLSPSEFQPSTYEAVVTSFEFSGSAASRTMHTKASSLFELAILDEQNTAERALVAALIAAVAQCADASLSIEGASGILKEIVSSSDAKQAHVFRGQEFRDYVSTKVGSVVTVDPMDAASLSLGMAWLGDRHPRMRAVKGVKECTQFLNSIVSKLEQRVCKYLAGINRRELVLLALNNHEASAVDRSLWNRTARAVLAIHDDKEAARETIRSHEYELNAVFQTSRLIVEAAICECPIENGRKPGELDLARLMAMMRQIFDTGGLSDAIRWGAVDPSLKIGALGEIAHKGDFLNEVILPFAKATSDQGIQRAVESYSLHFTVNTESADIHDILERQFLDAVVEQCAGTLREILSMLDAFERIGASRRIPIYVMRRSELIAACCDANTLRVEQLERMLEKHTLVPRSTWFEVPAGFREQDRQPWRYRRQLSVFRRPIIQLGVEQDPEVVVAPGLVRESVVKTLENYHLGNFPLYQLKPAMRAWAGKATDSRGDTFNTEVAEKLELLGWKVRPTIHLTEILGRPLQENFGDIDVLAWRPEAGHVAIVECKDVQFRRTYGEISEQLSDFRGAKTSDGKNDLLLKHLRRVEVLTMEAMRVASFLKIRETPRFESVLVFRNTVPVQFALSRMKAKVRVLTIDELESL